MRLEIGEWLPDLPAFENPGATVAQNVIPFGNSYKSFASPVTYSNALDGRCQGGYSTRDNNSVVFNFVGDATKLYSETSPATFTDVSVSGGYSTSTEENWQFTLFNENVVLATNFNDPMQSITLGDTAFANLDDSAPKARFITTVKDFVVVGNTNDESDGDMPNRVRWAGIGDQTAWTVLPSTQADFQDLYGNGGWVMQVVGGEYGVIFQERAITRMSYIGSPVVFQFDEIERGRGTPASNSVVKFGNNIAYLGWDGFYIFDGQFSNSIGVNKVNKTFWDDVDQTNMHRIYAVEDPFNQIIFWCYPSSNNSDGRSDKILAFNYSPTATKRWAQASGLDIEYLYRSFGLGVTLEGLDAYSSSIDDLPFSLDSRMWIGNSSVLSGFSNVHKQVNFTGTALNAVVETQEAQVYEGFRSTINRIRPLVDGSGSITVQIGTRNILSESVSWGSAISPEANGDFSVRSNARYHRARLNISGGFNFVQGIDILDSRKGGSR